MDTKTSFPATVSMLLVWRQKHQDITCTCSQDWADDLFRVHFTIHFTNPNTTVMLNETYNHIMSNGSSKYLHCEGELPLPGLLIPIIVLAGLGFLFLLIASGWIYATLFLTHQSRETGRNAWKRRLKKNEIPDILHAMIVSRVGAIPIRSAGWTKEHSDAYDAFHRSFTVRFCYAQ